MKSYKEYYQFGLEHYLDWKSKQNDEWWRRNELKGKLNLEGDYIETINVLSEYEKNDSSIFTNHTNVKNSGWDILFSMLGQALVDWFVENVDYKQIWSFDLKVTRFVNNGINFYVPSFKVKNFEPDGSFVKTIDETNTEKLNKYKECADFLCDLLGRFIEDQGVDVPNNWNYFSFGLDSLYDSCKYGEWVCVSDGYMNLLNYIDGEKDYETFVECM